MNLLTFDRSMNMPEGNFTQSRTYASLSRSGGGGHPSPPPGSNVDARVDKNLLRSSHPYPTTSTPIRRRQLSNVFGVIWSASAASAYVECSRRAAESSATGSKPASFASRRSRGGTFRSRTTITFPIQLPLAVVTKVVDLRNVRAFDTRCKGKNLSTSRELSTTARGARSRPRRHSGGALAKQQFAGAKGEARRGLASGPQGRPAGEPQPAGLKV